MDVVTSTPRRFPSWARALVSASALPIVIASYAITYAAVGASAASGAGSAIALLGIQTLLSASTLVEVGSFFRREWRVARLDGPDAHARRLRTMAYVAFALAAAQAWQLAKGYASMGATLGAPILCGVFLGGFTLQVLAARYLGRWGLVNGALALLAAQAVVDVGREALETPDVADELAWRSPVLVVAAAALTATAVFLVARRRVEVEHGPARDPYRVAEPTASTTIETPAAPVGVVALLLAATLRGAVLNVSATTAEVAVLRTSAHVLIGIVIALVIGSILVSPSRLSPLWSRATGHVLLPDGAREVTRASRDAVVRGVAFAAALGGLATIVPMRLWHVALGAAVVIDAVRAYRARKLAEDWVPAWPEPRAAAVAPALEALRRANVRAYAADGLATSLHPWIGPAAPTLLMVPAADLERARDVLARVLPDDAPAAAPVRPGDDVATIRPDPRARALLVRAVLGLGVVTAAAVGLVAFAAHEPAIADAPRASLQLRYVDDLAARQLRDVALPAGAAVFDEDAAGAVVPYVRFVPVHGETLLAARERATEWAKTAAPPGTEILVGAFEEDLDDGDGPQQVGWRTWLVKPDVIVRGEDVVKASAHGDEVEGRAVVSIQLTATGADAFATATRMWTRRRVAIVVDEVVLSAPVVESEIQGGHIRIMMGAGAPDRQLQEARALASSLMGRGAPRR